MINRNLLKRILGILAAAICIIGLAVPVYANGTAVGSMSYMQQLKMVDEELNGDDYATVDIEDQKTPLAAPEDEKGISGWFVVIVTGVIAGGVILKSRKPKVSK